MNLLNRAMFNAQRDYARRLRERRARENVITALVLIAMLASCIGAGVMVYVSWFAQ